MLWFESKNGKKGRSSCCFCINGQSSSIFNQYITQCFGHLNKTFIIKKSNNYRSNWNLPGEQEESSSVLTTHRHTHTLSRQSQLGPDPQEEQTGGGCIKAMFVWRLLETGRFWWLLYTIRLNEAVKNTSKQNDRCPTAKHRAMRTSHCLRLNSYTQIIFWITKGYVLDIKKKKKKSL